MKIKTVTFEGNVKAGEIFTWGGNTYMKLVLKESLKPEFDKEDWETINEKFNSWSAVNLETGVVDFFIYDDEVKIIKK